jgi:hypothetical protein
VGVLVELGVANPVPALNAPAVPHQLQQGFWGRAQAGQKHVVGLERLAVSGAGGDHLHDPAGVDPGLPDVLRGLFSAQRPGDVPTVTDLVIRCPKRDFALSLELAADLAVQRLLVGFNRQEEVGPLLLELPKNIPSPRVAPFGSITPTADPTPHPRNSCGEGFAYRDRLEKADQVEIGCSRGAFKHRKGSIPPTKTHGRSNGKEPCDRL